MTLAPSSADEAERLRVLAALGLGADERWPALDALTRLAARHCDCTASAIGLVAADRQAFIAGLGIALADTPRAGGFCELAMQDPNGLVVPDARLDRRFAGHPLLAMDPPLVFYAGLPLSVGGQLIGTVCVMDRQPRALDRDQLAALAELATLCSALLEARHRERLAASVGPVQLRLAAVLQAIPDLWFVLDATGRYAECSDEKHLSLVRPYAQLHGHDFGHGLPPSLAERGRVATRKARSSGEVQRFEYELDCDDGQRRRFEARVSPMAEGRSLCLMRDLTALRRREREVLVLQRSLEADAAQPICVADASMPDFPLVYVNPAFERLTGHSRDAVLGRNCRFLQGERGNEPALADLRAALAQGRPCTVTLRNVRRDGSSFINELHVAPVRDANGQLTHFVGMPNDVTERVLAAERLALSEDLYREVAAAIDDCLVVIDPDDIVRAANPAACEMFGASAEQLIGAPLGELGITLLHEDGSALADAEHPLLHRVASGLPSRLDAVYLLRRGDAPQRRVRLRLRPLQGDSAARQPTCLLTLTDIASAHAAEHAARERQATDLANRAKSEFLSRVSHEMRTPLNAVIGFTQLLRLTPGGAGPAQVADYTDHVLRASEHLLGLINDLLDLQRVEEKRLTLQLQPLALTTLVGATFALLKPLALQHRVALRNEVAPSAWVQADAQRLRQVLINVVSNAIKYNRSGGWVRIQALPVDAGQLVLEVDDTGSGLTQDQLARLFQPFERLGHESSDIEGSGLGLVIARRLVEAMGGVLTLSSMPTSGTRVQIALPCAQAPAASSARPPTWADRSPGPPRTPGDAAAAPAPTPAVTATKVIAAAPALTGPGLRMLYVEDNRINAILFEEAVRMRGGIDLQVAEDGAEALALVLEWQPEVLVLDANLPDMSGYDVLARMRKLPALEDVPAFMCSADAMESDLQRASAAGFIGYWTKPIDIARVMRDLDRLRLRRPAD